MQRGRIFFYLAFIVILGLVAVVVVYQRFLKPSAASPAATSQAAAAPTQEAMVNVIVATQKISQGGVIDEKVIGEVPMPQSMVIPGMYFTNKNDVIGRMARTGIEPRTLLTSGMLLVEGEQLSSAGSPWAMLIPRGMVAVAIPIASDELYKASAIKDGDHVNVIASVMFVDLDTDFQTALPNKTGAVIAPGPGGEGQPAALTANVMSGGGAQGRAEIDPVLRQTIYLVPSEAQRPRLASQALLQDVIVLHVDSFKTSQPGVEPTPTPQPQQGQQQQQQQPPPEPQNITLVVSPQDAITLKYLLNAGAQVSLALRPTGDDSRVQTEAVTLQFLLDQYRIPVPVKLPYGAIPPQAPGGAPVPGPTQ